MPVWEASSCRDQHSWRDMSLSTCSAILKLSAQHSGWHCHVSVTMQPTQPHAADLRFRHTQCYDTFLTVLLRNGWLQVMCVTHRILAEVIRKVGLSVRETAHAAQHCMCAQQHARMRYSIAISTSQLHSFSASAALALLYPISVSCATPASSATFIKSASMALLGPPLLPPLLPLLPRRLRCCRGCMKSSSSSASSAAAAAAGLRPRFLPLVPALPPVGGLRDMRWQPLSVTPADQVTPGTTVGQSAAGAQTLSMQSSASTKRTAGAHR